MKILFLFLSVLNLVSQCQSRPTFLDRVPNGRSFRRSTGGFVALGHLNPAGGAPGNPGLNSFGLDFLSQGFAWTEALCKKDSDNDGRTNGEELGDPNCVWKQGDTPQVTTGLSLPGSADTVAPSTSSSISPTTSFAPTTIDYQGGGGGEGENQDAYNYNMWVAHAVIMNIAFALLLPLGTLFPIIPPLRQSGIWFKLHQGFLISFILLALIGFIIALVNLQSEDGSLSDTTTTNHGRLGITLIVFILLQALIGFLRPHLPKANENGEMNEKSLPRKIFEIAHPNFGRIIFILTWIQIWFGYQRLVTYIPSASVQSVSTWALFQVTFFPILWFFLVCYFKYLRYRKVPTTEQPGSVGEKPLINEKYHHEDDGPSESIMDPAASIDNKNAQQVTIV